ncbi:baseplate J/gp47 family protein [Variovorax gossypii]
MKAKPGAWTAKSSRGELMPFNRPTLPELIDQGAAEYESRLPGLLVRVRRSLVGVLNRVVSGALSALYQYAEYLNRQAWPDTCDVEYLDGHGARWRVPRNAAESATGSVAFSGANDKVIPAGTQVGRTDGWLYVTTADVTIVLGAALAPVRSVLPGQAGNATVDLSLSLTSPIAGVNAVATASTALAGGADTEDHEPYRARILARIRKPPQGGAGFDYVAWAKQIAGVTRVWTYPDEQGRGTVVVRFLRDLDASPIPDAGEVATVQAHLQNVRPVTARVYAVAPVAAPIPWQIRVVPDTPAVRAAVEAELAAMLRRDAVPGGTILWSHANEAVSIAPGEFDHLLVAPAADVTNPTGYLSTMGPITWLP